MTNLPTLEYISWQEIHRLGFELSQKLEKQPKQANCIVSIARGGHVLSRLLSDFLSIPIYSVSIQSYQAMQQHELQIEQEISVDLAGKQVLLVDEVVDTGKTLERATIYLSDLGVSGITSVALHVKPQAQPKPDLYAATTDNWIVYPYEIRESIEALKPKWQAAGKTISDLKQDLTELGINPNYLSHYL